MEDIAGGMLSQDLGISLQQTLSIPVCIGTRLPQMHLNFEPKIVYMQNNKQTQSIVTLCDADACIQQDSNTFSDLGWISYRCDENRTHVRTIYTYIKSSQSS